MDDLTVTATSVPGYRWLLQGLQRFISWARMSFKPAKSRSLVLKKGKVGRKWQAQEAVDRAEARLQHNVLVGNVAVGRAGLGSFPKPRYDKTRGREKRQLVQDEIRAEVEEDHWTSKTPGLGGRTPSSTSSPGHSCGLLNHCASSSSFVRCMTLSLAHPTYIAGAW